ncbi:calmodulin-binding protein 60 B-like isoform X2 [Rhodamnia argentea]|uniref:Calmodulin-binding protein 60 B-like isoform X2 n=1 Tax=Rhodamnia argentea TaxID=178133 RepID=A0A8B8R3L5_9MYRT|nr:calmodulin-binding protein 60 B-like isoform X2 [Rhodamnia argentea]
MQARQSGKYRLGVKVVCRCYAAMHIRGTLSKAFTVEDSHGEFAKKHSPLLLSDYVWRLVGVAMGGEAHKQLTGTRIVTVRDFVDLLSLDQSRLRNIVGGGMSDAVWKHTLEHATFRVSNAKEYVYYFGEGQSTGIRFNWNYELKGLIRDGRFVAMESLSGGEKVYLESQ